MKPLSCICGKIIQCLTCHQGLPSYHLWWMTHLWLHEPDSCTSPPPHGLAVVELQQKWKTLLIPYTGAKTVDKQNTAKKWGSQSARCSKNSHIMIKRWKIYMFTTNTVNLWGCEENYGLTRTWWTLIITHYIPLSKHPLKSSLSLIFITGLFGGPIFSRSVLNFAFLILYHVPLLHLKVR